MKKSTKYRSCRSCSGQGKVKLAIGRRARRRYLRQVKRFENGSENIPEPKPLISHIDICRDCKGSGIEGSDSFPKPDIEKYPDIAIIGGGIAGVAFAVACLHRGIPFSLYERDESFDARSQGYGLTLQQASKAMQGLGISELKQGLISTRHVVHDTSGKVIGEWGRRQLTEEEQAKKGKPRNIHISRQELRKELLKQLQNETEIQWGHCLKDITFKNHSEMELEFLCNGVQKIKTADLVVGADGIRSQVRKLSIGDEKSPLKYLGCIVILGICRLEDLTSPDHSLLDGATVFQTVNGNERIYMMPYDTDNVMWQLSFLISEGEARSLSKDGPEALKNEAIQRLATWHDPISEILRATNTEKISGYPVYDREPLDPEDLSDLGNMTLLGDAMHPMSPFKGQGANQAILDALDLARDISIQCNQDINWKKKGVRKVILENFEKKMLERSTLKVRDSAKAVRLLHSNAVLHDGDIPRGRGIEENGDD